LLFLPWHLVPTVPSPPLTTQPLLGLGRPSVGNGLPLPKLRMLGEYFPFGQVEAGFWGGRPFWFPGVGGAVYCLFFLVPEPRLSSSHILAQACPSNLPSNGFFYFNGFRFFLPHSESVVVPTQVVSLWLLVFPPPLILFPLSPFRLHTVSCLREALGARLLLDWPVTGSV